MGLSRTSRKRSQHIRDWSVGAIVKQSHLAVNAPDLRAYTHAVIAQANRQDRADPVKVLTGIDNVLSAQMDAYAKALTSVDADQVVAMRQALYARPDFHHGMFFDGLTYFGSGGIAMCNGLAGQLDNLRDGFVQLISNGDFDRD
jgi:hypothetical protein